MSANGQLLDSELAPIPGGFRLRLDAAAAFNAMNAEQTVIVRDAYRALGHPGDYRAGRWSQWAAWERFKAGGSLAAYPGTSNHGWGTAIDVLTPAYRAVVDRIGSKYGWSKSWSDAPGEWWHILYQPGHYHPPAPDPFKYAQYPTGPFPSVYGNLNERAVVLEYDKLAAHPTPANAKRLAELQAQVRFLRDRVWTVAHRDTPPSWSSDFRGWRWQRLNERLRGQVTKNA